ncbi:MAG: AraC family transcriptional regulator [Clostridia bacterium]|nr:AraC family transcriptional regulator [Clostridia bacterium]
MNTSVYYQFSTTYQNGNKTLLTPPWQSSNIVVPCNKFYFVQEGEIELVVDNKTYTVSENEWLLLPAGVLHSYRLTSIQYAKLYWLHFELNVNDKTFLRSINTPIKIKVKNGSKITNLFDKIFRLVKIDTFSAKLEIATYINSLVYTFINNAPMQIPISENDPIDETIKYILNNYNEPLSLRALADKANFSVSQFANLFKKRTGVSPMHYITITRLEHAKYLLEQTSHPIKKIIEEVGFLDSSYFSKMFKKYYGSTPLEYRASAQPLSKSRVMK